MPLTDQELRCIEFASQYLAEIHGGQWAVERYLDDEYPQEPSPEVITSNGDATAAIEVKRLEGDSAYLEYVASILSNKRYLVPSCGGHYTLAPPSGFQPTMDGKLRRYVKGEIERVAPTLEPEESGVILVPREGRIYLYSEFGSPYVYCSHGGPFSDLMRPLMERIGGKFMLIDDEGWEHSFFTEEGREGFYQAVVEAYQRRVNGDASSFTWYEEWQLTRDRDVEDSQDGVWIIAVTGGDMKESVAECVDAVLENAVRKFENRRWADHHVLVLETSISAPEDLVTVVIANLEPSALKAVDLVLLVNEQGVTHAHQIA